MVWHAYSSYSQCESLLSTTCADHDRCRRPPKGNRGGTCHGERDPSPHGSILSLPNIISRTDCHCDAVSVEPTNEITKRHEGCHCASVGESAASKLAHSVSVISSRQSAVNALPGSRS
jgi:hypothetical protein